MSFQKEKLENGIKNSTDAPLKIPEYITAMIKFSNQTFFKKVESPPAI